MIKRLVWFVGGIVTGVTGVVFAGRRVKKRVETLAPVKVARQATSKVRDRLTDVGDAVREGRETMHAKEAELRARRDGRLEPLDRTVAPVGPQDALLVDGEPVEPGRVVVLRQIDPGFVASKRPRR